MSKENWCSAHGYPLPCGKCGFAGLPYSEQGFAGKAEKLERVKSYWAKDTQSDLDFNQGAEAQLQADLPKYEALQAENTQLKVELSCRDEMIWKLDDKCQKSQARIKESQARIKDLECYKDYYFEARVNLGKALNEIATLKANHQEQIKEIFKKIDIALLQGISGDTTLRKVVEIILPVQEQYLKPEGK
jgi:predicted nuclease with TOPRIM domain